MIADQLRRQADVFDLFDQSSAAILRSCCARESFNDAEAPTKSHMIGVLRRFVSPNQTRKTSTTPPIVNSMSMSWPRAALKVLGRQRGNR